MHPRPDRASPPPARAGLCLCLWLLLSAAFAAQGKPPAQFDYLVAQDGSGDFTTVQAALDAVPDNQSTRTVIYVRNGIYDEKVLLPASKQNVTLIGENRDKTVLTGDDRIGTLKPTGRPMSSLDTWTLAIEARRFQAIRLTVANTAGDVGQALAVRVTGDQSRFVNCRFVGYQDTLYLGGNRQYFKQCIIEGAVDFIFGKSVAVFDDCDLICQGLGFVTAASTTRKQAFGFVFRHCEIRGDAAPGVLYLGRPWRKYGRTAFIQCAMGSMIAPSGRNNWAEPANEDTAYFAEYKSSGAGALPGQRADWSHQLTAEEAGAYTLKNIFEVNEADPDLWYKD